MSDAETPFVARDAAATLRTGDERIALRFVWDPNRQARAMAHGAGYALSYVGRLDEGPGKRALVAVANALKQHTSEPSLENALAAVADALPDGAGLIGVRAWMAGQKVPRWPAHLRSVQHQAAETQFLWPMDPEAAALAAGIRTLLKREGVLPGGADAEERWLRSFGLVTRQVPIPESDAIGILAAVDATTLEMAYEAEVAVRSRSANALDAAAWLGEALGYPTCCRARFVEQAQHDDLTLMTSCLPEAGEHGPAPVFTQWISGPLALVSHTPCSLECEASVEIARRALDVIESWRPGWSEAWRHLAQRVHAIDRDGRIFALQVDGSLRDGVVSDAVEILVATDPTDFDIVRPRLELAGAPVRTTNGLMAVGTLRATIVADHRAGGAANAALS